MRVGLALSGGGFRAASFHLGVLKRLDELCILSRVELLSCVSGGSIVGAMYGLACVECDGRPGTADIDTLIERMRSVVTTNVRGRALFGTPARTARTLASFIFPGLTPRASRVGLIAEEMDRCLFNGARLTQLPPWIVLNATNLRTGKAWKFYSDAAGDYLAGVTSDTAGFRVADAVAASAAFPGLTDPFLFRTTWEALTFDKVVPPRWERPRVANINDHSSWRQRFGTSGKVTFPLVDGGAYDNEGLNALRSAKLSHVIYSSTAPLEGDVSPRIGLAGTLTALGRTVGVMHTRLGAVTRQLAHEMTHAMHPTDAGHRASLLADQLDALAENAPTDLRSTLAAIAGEVRLISRVGEPGRGSQFAASAPIMLNKTELAEGRIARNQRIPESTGLRQDLVRALAAVRTDLDALDPIVFDLLLAQGYYATDAYVALCMPDLVQSTNSASYGVRFRGQPDWERAVRYVSTANLEPVIPETNISGADESVRSPIGLAVKSAGASRSIFETLTGRSRSPREAIRVQFWAGGMVVALFAVLVLAVSAAYLLIRALFHPGEICVTVLAGTVLCIAVAHSRHRKPALG